jgi:hypothetical protein
MLCVSWPSRVAYCLALVAVARAARQCATSTVSRGMTHNALAGWCQLMSVIELTTKNLTKEKLKRGMALLQTK